MKQYIQLLVSTFLFPCVANADKYQILAMNTPTIQIGEKFCQLGDEFSDKDDIVWAKDNQALKALNTEKKTIHLFAAPNFKKHDTKTVFDYMTRSKHLSTRGSMTLKELENYLSDEFFLLDTICIETTELTDNQHVFRMSYYYDGKVVKKHLQCDDGDFFITRSLFPDDASTSEFTVTISYANRKIKKKYRLTKSMKIILLPTYIDTPQ